MITAVKTKYNYFLETQKINDLRGVSYDFLDSIGLVNISTQTKQRLYKETLTEIKEDGTVLNLQGINEDTRRLRAKKLALEYMFRSSAELGKDIFEFLEQKNLL